MWQVPHREALIGSRCPCSCFPKVDVVRTSTKVNIVAILAAVAVVGIIAFLAVVRPFSPSREDLAASTPVVAENSHRLDTAKDSGVTFTEFVDFECEVCAAVYPFVEQLREDYAGEVTFVTRYFPLPGHFNSMNAALAVEAAAQQGRFEQMYHKVFQTQSDWGEQQVSKADLFRQFAAELGLDMVAYDKAVADPATKQRVQFDFDAGRDLGVEATPTIFINDTKIDLESTDAVRAALDDGLNR